jgi:hypothetical protein
VEGVTFSELRVNGRGGSGGGFGSRGRFLLGGSESVVICSVLTRAPGSLTSVTYL